MNDEELQEIVDTLSAVHGITTTVAMLRSIIDRGVSPEALVEMLCDITTDALQQHIADNPLGPIALHEWLLRQFPDDENADLRQDEGDDDIMASVLITNDSDAGPAHVIYREDAVDVHRYWDFDAPVIIRRIPYNTPDFFARLAEACSRDLSEDW